MKIRRRRLRDTPTVLRKMRVSFTINGERITYTKVQRVRKSVGKKYFCGKLPRSSLNTTQEENE